MSHNFMTVLGDEWFQTFSLFRLNPETFFDKKKLTREAFCFDVLRDIYLDHINVKCKIHLLLLLQEYSTTLIKEINLLEQIVGSLVNLFNVLEFSAENRLLKSQILIALTTILLTCDLENVPEGILSSVKQLLYDIIFNESSDPVIISTACNCMQEIELFFPNILESKIKCILQSCEKHTSPAFQSLALLLSLCIKNACLKSQKILMPSDKNDILLCGKDGIQLSSVISYLLELIPLMSSICAYKVLKNLISVVQFSSNISSMVFKLFLPNLIFSSEISYFHLAFEFLALFREELFTEQEKKCFLRQLMLLSSHPCLTMSHRMLFLDWLKNCLQNREIFSCEFSVLQPLLPGPFDGPMTQEKKSCILALCVSPKVNKNLCLDFLNESVSGLKKCALLPGGMKAAPSFFRTLYIYFSLHKTEFMHNYLYKLLVGIMKTSPHLLQYALNFFTSVRVEFPESTFPKEALSHLVDHILSLPMKQFLGNLKGYLAILEQASEVCGSECKPRSILRLLQKLLADSDSYKENTWEFGNNILSVCQSILKFHDVQFFYYDLAEVLCLISQNVNDVDVKDRAKIYYSALTTLSKIKIQSIFKVQLPKRDSQNPLTTLSGVNANLQFVPCVQALTKSVVQLVRIEKNWYNSFDNSGVLHSMPDVDLLKVYIEHLESSESVVQLPFILKHVSNSEDTFSSLYGVVISSDISPSCKKISEVEIPVYKKSKTKNEDSVFYVDIIPHESHPIELHFNIQFSCNNGFSYVYSLNPVFLNFNDFFLTMPIPSVLQNCELSWRKSVFEALWEKFEQIELCGFKDKCCCKSSFCLNVNKDDLPFIIEKHWKQFIVARFGEYSCWIAIFLPPENHWLMKIDVINEKSFVNFIVDDVSVLPWIALYLQDIEKD